MKKNKTQSRDFISEKRYPQKDAAKILGVSVSTISRLTKRGAIDCFRIGGSVMYSESQINQFLAKSERLTA